MLKISEFPKPSSAVRLLKRFSAGRFNTKYQQISILQKQLQPGKK